MADLSKVRNAVRDVGQSMQRFERDFERMQREAKAALADGVSEAAVTAAANEGLRGHPDLQARVRRLVSGLEAREEANSDG